MALAQPVTVRTHSLRTVEAEHLRIGGLKAQAAPRARKPSRQQHVVRGGRHATPPTPGCWPRVGILVDDAHDRRPLADGQGQIQRFRQPGPRPLAQHESVDHDLNVMATVAVERRRIGQINDLAIHASAHEPLVQQLLEQIPVLTLLGPHFRCEQHKPGVWLHIQDARQHLLPGLGADRLAAVRAMLHAGPGEQDPGVIVDLRDRSHRAARVPATGLLLDRDRRGQPGDLVHVRLGQLSHKLARIGAERLDVAALPLGVQGIERQAALAAARDAGKAHQLVLGDLERDAAKVVLPGPDDADHIGRGPRRERGCAGLVGIRHGNQPATRDGPGASRVAARRVRVASYLGSSIIDCVLTNVRSSGHAWNTCTWNSRSRAS